jgi:hypothetical protein
MGSVLKAVNIKHLSSTENNLILDENGYVSVPILLNNVSTFLKSGSGIIIKGVNSNGNYIQFDNGIMICYKMVSITTTISGATGAVFYTSGTTFDLGSWPVVFTSVSSYIISLMDRSVHTAWLASEHLMSTTSAGTVQLASSASRASTTYLVSAIAIGRWK